MPGTFPSTCRAIFWMPSPGWNVTVAELFSSSAGWPACPSVCESAIEKHAPLVTESTRPLPLIRSPFQVTSAVRSVAIGVSFQNRVHGHGRAGLDQLREGTALACARGQPVQRLRVCFFYTRAREKLGSDDSMRSVLDLVERHRGVHVEVFDRCAGAGQLSGKRHRV